MNLLSIPANMRGMMAKQLLAASGITDPIAGRMADRLFSGQFGAPELNFEKDDTGEMILCTAQNGKEVLTVTLNYRIKPEETG